MFSWSVAEWGGVNLRGGLHEPVLGDRKRAHNSASNPFSRGFPNILPFSGVPRRDTPGRNNVQANVFQRHLRLIQHLGARTRHRQRVGGKPHATRNFHGTLLRVNFPSNNSRGKSRVGRTKDVELMFPRTFRKDVKDRRDSRHRTAKTRGFPRRSKFLRQRVQCSRATSTDLLHVPNGLFRTVLMGKVCVSRRRRLNEGATLANFRTIRGPFRTSTTNRNVPKYLFGGQTIHRKIQRKGSCFGGVHTKFIGTKRINPREVLIQGSNNSGEGGNTSTGNVNPFRNFLWQYFLRIIRKGSTTWELVCFLAVPESLSPQPRELAEASPPYNGSST